MSGQEMPAAYEALWRSGELSRRVQEAYQRLERCDLCPRACGVNRRQGELGMCRTGELALVASYGPHFGEEAPLVGASGSGTIFFANCNLRCCYCQNYEISQLGEGHTVLPRELATMMLRLQRMGCHNVNLVSPSHVVPQILAAVEIAAADGLCLPLVYNTGGYDALSTLQLLDGVVDIYMPDMKYADAEIALRLSGIRDYPAANRAAIREMHRQVGDLTLDAHGIVTRGLLVRHLVLPDRMAGTEEIVRFLATEISLHTYLNIMAQYRPCYQAHQVPGLGRSISQQEYLDAVGMALRHGLTRLDEHPGRGRLAI